MNDDTQANAAADVSEAADAANNGAATATADTGGSELAAAKAQAEDNYNKFLYAMADFENYKKRMERQLGEIAACPDLEDQTKIFKLLKPEETIGVRITEGFHLEPEQSTNALIVHHPQAKYFVV